MMFGLSNNKETVYLRSDILEQIQHELQIIILNEVKQFNVLRDNVTRMLHDCNCYIIMM